MATLSFYLQLDFGTPSIRKGMVIIGAQLLTPMQAGVKMTSLIAYILTIIIVSQQVQLVPTGDLCVQF